MAERRRTTLEDHSPELEALREKVAVLEVERDEAERRAGSSPTTAADVAVLKKRLAQAEAALEQSAGLRAKVTRLEEALRVAKKEAAKTDPGGIPVTRPPLKK